MFAWLDLPAAGRWLWNPEHFWTIWLWGLVVGVFAVREFTALFSHRAGETFSWWVWNHLKIHVGESISQWTFPDYAFFVLYIGVFSWLLGHFFWRWWAAG